MKKREGGRPLGRWQRSRRARARGWGGEGAGSPGPAPGRPERPAVPLTSGSRKPQSRAVAAVCSGRCGPIGLLGARRRGASRRAQAPGPAPALPRWPGRTSADGGAWQGPPLLLRPPLQRRLPLPAPPRGHGNPRAGHVESRSARAASRAGPRRSPVPALAGRLLWVWACLFLFPAA